MKLNTDPCRFVPPKFSTWNLKMMGFQKESSLTTINSQVRTVSFREGISISSRTTKIAVSQPSWSTPNSKFFVFFFARLKQDSNGLGPLCFQKELTEKLFSQRGATRFSSMKKPFPFPFLLKLFKFNNDSPRAARLSGILPHKPKLISKSLGTEPKRRVWDVWSYWNIGGFWVIYFCHWGVFF